jgi:hypothetical protein
VASGEPRVASGPAIDRCGGPERAPPHVIDPAFRGSAGAPRGDLTGQRSPRGDRKAARSNPAAWRSGANASLARENSFQPGSSDRTAPAGPRRATRWTGPRRSASPTGGPSRAFAIPSRQVSFNGLRRRLRVSRRRRSRHHQVAHGLRSMQDAGRGTGFERPSPRSTHDAEPSLAPSLRAQTVSPARWIAAHTRDDVSGIWRSCTPSGASASRAAFMTAGSAATQPASPTPFAPTTSPPHSA